VALVLSLVEVFASTRMREVAWASSIPDAQWHMLRTRILPLPEDG
jgi:hypothetical protein